MNREAHKRVWETVVSRGEYDCFWCRLPFNGTDRPPTRDHIVTRRHFVAGRRRPTGYVLACSRCNHDRGSESFMDYAKRIGRFDLLDIKPDPAMVPYVQPEYQSLRRKHRAAARAIWREAARADVA